MYRKQGLIGRHNMPTGTNRSFANRLCRAVLATDQLHHHIHIGFARHSDGIIEPVRPFERDTAVFRAIARRHSDDLDRATTALRDQRTVGLQDVNRSRTNRTQTCDRNPKCICHIQYFLFCRNGHLRGIRRQGQSLLRIRQQLLQAPGGLPDTLGVLHQRNPHMTIAVLTKAQPRRNGNMGLLEQQF